MEKRYIDALTEICGATSVLYEMSDIERYLYDETEEYVRPKACEDCIVVRPGTYEEVSEILKWQTKNLCRLSLEVAVQVPAVQLFRQSHL